MKKLFPTTLVGSYPQPDWLIDRPRLAGRFPPRVRARELWRVGKVRSPFQIRVAVHTGQAELPMDRRGEFLRIEPDLPPTVRGKRRIAMAGQTGFVIGSCCRLGRTLRERGRRCEQQEPGREPDDLPPA